MESDVSDEKTSRCSKPEVNTHDTPCENSIKNLASITARDPSIRDMKRLNEVTFTVNSRQLVISRPRDENPINTKHGIVMSMLVPSKPERQRNNNLNIILRASTEL